MRSERLIPRADGQLEWNVACGVSRYLSAATDSIRFLIGPDREIQPVIPRFSTPYNLWIFARV